VHLHGFVFVVVDLHLIQCLFLQRVFARPHVQKKTGLINVSVIVQHLVLWLEASEWMIENKSTIELFGSKLYY
jgi:hypothetical protein